MTKKIISLLLVLAALLSLTACGNDPKAAVWKTYDEKMPFIEILSQKFMTNQDKALKVQVSHEKGWKEAKDLNDKDVPKDAKAISYKVEVFFPDDEVETTYFFMTITDKELSFVSAVEYDGDNTYVYDEKEAIEKLNGEF